MVDKQALTEERVVDPHERKDMQCNCFLNQEPQWGPACKGKYVPYVGEFFDEWCADCGHSGACHE